MKLKSQLPLLLFLSALLLVQIEGHKFTVTSQIWMDVAHDGELIGRVTIGLFGYMAPKTVANFRHICLKGINGMSYNGTKFHRIIDRFMVQGGDIVFNNGHGSISIYGEHFNDEYKSIKHSGPGFIGMANHGENTNGCQFYITTIALPWLDGKHTVFGKVVEGQGYIHHLEKVKTDTDDKPLKPAVILACGDAPMKHQYQISDIPYDFQAWLKAASLPLGFSFGVMTFFYYIIRQLDKYI